MEKLYHHIENSLHQNSKNIYNNSIFPIVNVKTNFVVAMSLKKKV